MKITKARLKEIVAEEVKKLTLETLTPKEKEKKEELEGELKSLKHK